MFYIDFLAAPAAVAPTAAPGYGAPAADSYGSPQAAPATDSYGSPQAAPSVDSYGSPKAPAVDSYGSPKAPVTNSYGAPKPSYGAPKPSYGAPKPSYGADTKNPCKRTDLGLFTTKETRFLNLCFSLFWRCLYNEFMSKKSHTRPLSHTH